MTVLIYEHEKNKAILLMCEQTARNEWGLIDSHTLALYYTTALFLNTHTGSHINFTGGLMENQPLMFLLCVPWLTEGRNIQHYQRSEANKGLSPSTQLYSTIWIIKNIKQASVSAS